MKLKAFIFSFFIFLSLSSFALADAPPVEVKATAAPTRATMGDEIKLAIQIDRPKKFEVRALPQTIALPPFEVKRVEHRSENKRGRVYEIYTVVLTIFEVGDFTIPPVMVHVSDGQGASYDFPTKPFLVKIVSVAKRPTDKDQIRPIKGPVSYAQEEVRVVLCGLLIFILAFFLSIKVYWRIKNKGFLDRESRLPAHQRAALELERLKKKEWLNEHKDKEYSSELADILRRYLERRYDIAALELTTFELLALLKEKNFDKSHVTSIRELLENTDLVKFAKLNLPKELAVSLENNLSGFVNATQEVEAKK